MAMNDVFEHFAADTDEGNGSVIRWRASVAFLEKRSDYPSLQSSGTLPWRIDAWYIKDRGIASCLE